MIDWQVAEGEWRDFCGEVDAMRRQLGCLNDHAWFRGVDDFGYELTPSLYRSERYSLVRCLWDLGERVDGILRSDQRLGMIRKFLASVSRCGVQRHELSAYLDPEIEILHQTLKRSDRKTYVESALVTDALLELLRKLRCAPPTSRDNGEYDAYAEFSQRYGDGYSTSWEQLAAMQHYGCGTRLLDWTDDLFVALGFSLVKYYDVFQGCPSVRQAGSLPSVWHPRPQPNWSKMSSHHAQSVFVIDSIAASPRALPSPAIWVCNPFKMAKWATSSASIVNVNIHEELDYAQRVLCTDDWPFARPVPILVPWSNRRLRAQRGVFTVHGRDPRALNRIVGSHIDWGSVRSAKSEFLGRVTMSPLAAVFALKVVRDDLGLDDYALYGDLRDLGARVRRRHID